MTTRYDLWIAFLAQRDSTILALAALALIIVANWLMWRSRRILMQLMLIGGAVTYIVLIVISGGAK